MGNNRYHLYQRERGKNYNYQDRVIKSYLEQSGALFHIYKLLYTVSSDGTKHEIGSGEIADSILNENPYRKYSREVYDLYGVTKMNTPKWVFSIEGYTDLDGDEKEIVVHYNSMIAQLGRKLIIGDVVEISWLRDLDVLGSDKAQNKFYQIVESCREESSWDPTYRFHLWKIKVKPITDSSEFKDLFNYENIIPNQGYGESLGNTPFYEELGSINGGGGINPEISSADSFLKLNDAILDEANEKGPNYRLHDEHHIYMDQIQSLYDDYGRFIPEGIDGIAKSLNCDDIPYGDTFPSNPSDGSYFLKTSSFPCKLYHRERNEETNECKWVLQEYDFREEWTGVPKLVRRHINMDETMKTNDGSIVSKQQNIKDLVKARVKKEQGNERPWKEITKKKTNRNIPQGI